MRVYIESTIPSYLAARPSKNPFQFGRQQTTRDWWDTERQKHELFISSLVLQEISQGEPAMAQRRVAIVSGLKSLNSTTGVEKFAVLILKSGLLPASADQDAAHIALAAFHKMDILLTWNCRHISNAAIQARLHRLAQSVGLTLPTICGPERLMGE